MTGKLLQGIWTVSGPAGSGKTTLIKSLLENVAGAKPLRRIVTRPLRPTDTPEEYTHMSLDEFDRRHVAGELFSPVEIHGHMNGVYRSDLDAAYGSPQVTIADVNAVNAAKLFLYGVDGKWRNINRFRSVYLHVEDEDVLRQRLIERGEKEVERRIADCREWKRDAEKSLLYFHFVDASHPKKKVLEESLRIFTSL